MANKIRRADKNMTSRGQSSSNRTGSTWKKNRPAPKPSKKHDSRSHDVKKRRGTW